MHDWADPQPAAYCGGDRAQRRGSWSRVRAQRIGARRSRGLGARPGREQRPPDGSTHRFPALPTSLLLHTGIPAGWPAGSLAGWLPPHLPPAQLPTCQPYRAAVPALPHLAPATQPRNARRTQSIQRNGAGINPARQAQPSLLSTAIPTLPIRPTHQCRPAPPTSVRIQCICRVNSTGDGAPRVYLCTHGRRPRHPPVLADHQAVVVAQRLAPIARPAGVALVLAVALLVDGLVCRQAGKWGMGSGECGRGR